MTTDLTSIILDKSQEEMEKQLFGGNIYGMAHKFPSLYITNNKESEYNYYNIESFKNYVQLISNISNSCGSDLSLLFAESFRLYKIQDDSISHQSFKNKMITDFCTEALAHLSLAMKQSEKLLDIINRYDINKEINLEIKGKDYYFIIMVLNNLFYYYTTIVNFITNKRYLNIEFIKSISERLTFIVSEEFEIMRRIFKVIECYNEIDESPIFH